MREKEYYMKSKLCVVLAAFYVLGSLAYAQITTGVKQDGGKATERTSCLQMVVNSYSDMTGIMISSYNGEAILQVQHKVDSRLDSAFNRFGSSGDEKVYFLFAPDDVLTVTPHKVGSDTDNDYEYATFLYKKPLQNPLLN